MSAPSRCYRYRYRTGVLLLLLLGPHVSEGQSEGARVQLSRQTLREADLAVPSWHPDSHRGRQRRRVPSEAARERLQVRAEARRARRAARRAARAAQPATAAAREGSGSSGASERATPPGGSSAGREASDGVAAFPARSQWTERDKRLDARQVSALLERWGGRKDVAALREKAARKKGEDRQRAAGAGSESAGTDSPAGAPEQRPASEALGSEKAEISEAGAVPQASVGGSAGAGPEAGGSSAAAESRVVRDNVPVGEEAEADIRLAPAVEQNVSNAVEGERAAVGRKAAAGEKTMKGMVQKELGAVTEGEAREAQKRGREAEEKALAVVGEPETSANASMLGLAPKAAAAGGSGGTGEPARRTPLLAVPGPPFDAGVCGDMAPHSELRPRAEGCGRCCHGWEPYHALLSRAVTVCEGHSQINCTRNVQGQFIFCTMSDVYVLEGRDHWTAFCTLTTAWRNELFAAQERWSFLAKGHVRIAPLPGQPAPRSAHPPGTALPGAIPEVGRVDADVTYVSSAECDAPFNPHHCMADVANVYAVSQVLGHAREDMHVVLMSDFRDMRPGAPFFTCYQSLAGKVSVGPGQGKGSPVYPHMQAGNGTGLDGGGGGRASVRVQSLVYGMMPYMSLTWGEKGGWIQVPSAPLKSRWDKTCERWRTNRCTEESSVLIGLRGRMLERLNATVPALDLLGAGSAFRMHRQRGLPRGPVVRVPGLVVFALRGEPDQANEIVMPCRRCMHNFDQVWEAAAEAFPGQPMAALNFRGVPYEQQVRLLTMARLVVTVHGGFLGHTVWLREGQSVVELLPPDPRAPLAIYFHQAHLVGASWRGVFLPEDFSFSSGGEVDPEKVIQVMREELTGIQQEECAISGNFL